MDISGEEERRRGGEEEEWWQDVETCNHQMLIAPRTVSLSSAVAGSARKGGGWGQCLQWAPTQNM